MKILFVNIGLALLMIGSATEANAISLTPGEKQICKDADRKMLGR